MNIPVVQNDTANCEFHMERSTSTLPQRLVHRRSKPISAVSYERKKWSNACHNSTPCLPDIAPFC